MKKITFFLFLFVVLINSQKVKAVVPEKSDSTKVVKVYMVDTIHKKVYVVDSIITTTYIENAIYYYGDGVRYRRYYNIIPYYSYCWSAWRWGYYPSWHSFHHRSHYYNNSYRNRGYNYYPNYNNSYRNYGGQKPTYRKESGGNYNQHRPYRGNSSNSGTSRYSSPQRPPNNKGRNSNTKTKTYRQNRQSR